MRTEAPPAHSAWGEAEAQEAARELKVGYGGGAVTVPGGSTYSVDSFGRTLVGWHGTISPPLGMDGEPMT